MKSKYSIHDIFPILQLCQTPIKKQEDIDSLLQLDPNNLKLLSQESEILETYINELLKSSDKTYQGTDPVKDAIRYHRHKVIRRKKLEKGVDGKYVRNKNLRKDESTDPINHLGYGIKVYFRTLYDLFCIFLVLSILMIPTFTIYAQGEGFQDITN